jgi:hypothetical protein
MCFLFVLRFQNFKSLKSLSGEHYFICINILFSEWTVWKKKNLVYTTKICESDNGHDELYNLNQCDKTWVI